jgi:hypothetical protein
MATEAETHPLLRQTEVSRPTTKAVMQGLTGQIIESVGQRKEPPIWYEDLLENLGLKDQHIRCFQHVSQDGSSLNRRDLGVIPVPVERIVGTVSRCRDVRTDFQPSRNRSLPRLGQIREAMKRGEIMPPLELNRLRDEYYVLDGHHRVAVAKEMDMAYLDAHVVDYLPSSDTLEDALARERSNFEIATGLYRIELTQPGGYESLLEHIRCHQDHMPPEQGRSTSAREAGEDWYRQIYLPMVVEMRHELASRRVSERFPHRTVGDLYLIVAEHMRDASRHSGKEITLYEAMSQLQLEKRNQGWLWVMLDGVLPCSLTGRCPFAE